MKEKCDKCNSTNLFIEIIGKCKDCIYKCFRCEDINFRGVYQCKWNKEEKEKEYVQERIKM